MVWTIDTPDCRVIAALHLNQLAISSIISRLYFAADTVANLKHSANC